MGQVAVVTGAEGFIGSYLAHTLERQGVTTIGCFLVEPTPVRRGNESITWVQCDIRDPERVRAVFEEYRPDIVYHLAAQSLPTQSWSDPAYTMEVNVLGSLHIFEAARKLMNPPRVVAACSSAEYGLVDPAKVPIDESHPLLPLHPYGVSKVGLDLLAYQYHANYGLPVVRLRLFNTTGAGKTGDAASDFVRQLVRIRDGRQEPTIRVGNLETRRAFLDVSDTALAFELAAGRGVAGSVYNICASSTVQMRELLDTAIRLTGTSPEILAEADLMRPSDEKIIFGSSKKFTHDTGWIPQKNLEDTLRSMIKFWTEHPEA